MYFLNSSKFYPCLTLNQDLSFFSIRPDIVNRLIKTVIFWIKRRVDKRSASTNKSGKVDALRSESTLTYPPYGDHFYIIYGFWLPT